MKSKTIISLILGILLPFASVSAQSYDIPRLSPIPTEIPGIDNIRIDLDGTWKFNPVFKQEYVEIINPDEWSDIVVPGEWSMQGFNVDSGQAASYFRTFAIPKDWKRHRIKIRFNGVYSESIVFINGKEVGKHMGGFTAFELDITDCVNIKKENTLVLSVTNESLADSLASGSRYACHPLGGITRSVLLFPLPKQNISSLTVQTLFDDKFENAELKTFAYIFNESKRDKKKLRVELELFGPDAIPIIIPGDDPMPVPPVSAGRDTMWGISLDVDKPLKWDCENPYLHVLRIKLFKRGNLLETIEQKIGFRQVEVKGNQLFVNGMPIKLRGVNRHEVHPKTGRSVPKAMYRKDIEIFREGNVNHIRTSHYPPDEALMEAADELGMFIECEGPFCWSHETKADPERVREAITNQNLEMIVLYRNHPSVIIWSMANESLWTPEYEFAGKAMKKLDPSRPLTFNYFPWGWVKNNQDDEVVCALGSDHYPTPKGPEKYADYHRPISFGEFVHLNAYNRYELATDVALRDKWGIYLHDMWEDMYKSQGVAGGSIWAGIDDTFYWDIVNNSGHYEERTVGYGTWGPIDGWRRKKPEWWGMKKTYSPIRVSDVERYGDIVRFSLENRQDFSNINRLDIKWTIGKESGSLDADLKPHSLGQFEINTDDIPEFEARLQLGFIDPRGFMVDTFNLPISPYVVKYDTPELGSSTIIGQKEDDNHIIISVNDKPYKISKSTGLLVCDEFSGPQLMILPMNNGGDTQMHGPTKYYEPFNPICSDWKLDSVSNQFFTSLEIWAYGSYKEAKGKFIYKFHGNGNISVSYDFETLEDINPRQIGLVFDLPRSFENLYWYRKGYWSTYPDWHIARLKGTANASEGIVATQVGPRKKPDHEWRHDRTSIGSNDFASTKHNIYWTSLSSESGKQLEVRSNSSVHTRVWIHDEMIRMLVANYSNGGSERFLRPHSDKDDIYLKIGDKVNGTTRLIIND